MNELKKKIVRLYADGTGFGGGNVKSPSAWTNFWYDAEKALQSNKRAFSLMDPWMQEAMKLLPYNSAELRCGGGVWVNIPSITEDDPDGEGIDPTYRLNPACVFGEDAIEGDCGFVDIEVESSGLSRKISYRKHEISLSSASSYDDFMGYVYESGEVSLHPRVLRGDNYAAIPTAVRFKK